MLQGDVTDSINEKFQHFITTNKETAKELIPMKARRRKMKYREDEIIQLARSHIQVAYLTHTEDPSEEKHENLMRKRRY